MIVTDLILFCKGLIATLFCAFVVRAVLSCQVPPDHDQKWLIKVSKSGTSSIDQCSSSANWSPSTWVQWGQTWQGCHTCGKGTSEGPSCLSCRFPGGINQVEIYASKVQITELGMKYVFLLPEQNSSEPYLQQKALAFQVLSSFSDAEARDGFCSGVSGSSRFWTSCGSLRIQMCRCPERSNGTYPWHLTPRANKARDLQEETLWRCSWRSRCDIESKMIPQKEQR